MKVESSKFNDEQKVIKIQGLNWGHQNSNRKVDSTKFWDKNWQTKLEDKNEVSKIKDESGVIKIQKGGNSSKKKMSMDL